MIQIPSQLSGGRHAIIDGLLKLIFAGCLLALPCYCGTPPGDPSPLLLYVRTDHFAPFSKLKPGDELAGTLIRPVYSEYRVLFPSGSRVRLVLDKVERRKREARPDDRPLAIRLFARRHQLVPVIRSASVTLPDGSEVPVRASFLKLTRKVEIQYGAPKTTGGAGTALILTAEPFSTSIGGPPVQAVPLAPGTGSLARVILMQDLSASHSRRGDSFQARLAAPLRISAAVVLPAGSIFEGLVTKRVAPRRLSRPGTLALSFTSLMVPGAGAIPVSASLASVEVDQGSPMKMDSETALHGGSPGIGRMLLESGVTAGIAKITDDSMQLVLQVLISTATDASTAGTARIVAACASGVFMLTRHGRDVVLPRYTQMEIIVGRTPAGRPAGSPPPACAKLMLCDSW